MPQSLSALHIHLVTTALPFGNLATKSWLRQSLQRLHFGKRINVMRKIVVFMLLMFVFAISQKLSKAQDPDLVRYFDYDQKAPLKIKQIDVRRRAAATVYDITYDSPGFT
ncbi:MAG: hypothetical protein ABR607_09325 [Pyrinomonadaceae bacterium]